MNKYKIIRIGTRGSKLALIQTNMVKEKLEAYYPDFQFEIIEITTKGDKERVKPIYEFGGKAVFVEDIEKSISEGLVDIAVHSAKDMPNPCGKGMGIAGVLEREDPRDVLIYKKEQSVSEEAIFTIGTSSQRREYQIKAMYPNAICKNLRGNIGTRINKLRAGEYDAIILAKAGIKRQGLDKENDLSYMEIDIEDMLPAAGQGIIAIEALQDSKAYEMVKSISDARSEYALVVERKVLSEIEASCHEPVGVYVTEKEDDVSIELMRIVDQKIVRKKVTGKRQNESALIEELIRND